MSGTCEWDDENLIQTQKEAIQDKTRFGNVTKMSDLSMNTPASKEATQSDSESGKSSGWVKFDDATGHNNGDSLSPSKSPLQNSSPLRELGSQNIGGRGSARGTVNSSANHPHTTIQQQQMSPLSSQRAQLVVSDIKVVDEQALRKKNSMSGANSEISNGRVRNATNTSNTQSGGSSSDDHMDSVNLSDPDLSASTVVNPIRGKRFINGEVIVTLLPINERFPWVIPSKFRPELVPEELMAPVLTLTVEEYVQTIQKLTTDMRFTTFNVCYKRILVIWIALAFLILLTLLFSGMQGIQLFGCGVAWLILNAGAIFLCMWIKLRLNKQIESCMAFINTGLLKHNIILGIDDRGKLSCQKVNLCFIYFESAECIKKLEKILAEKPDEQTQQQNGQTFDREHYLRHVEQFDDVEVVVPGRSPVRVDRKRERAEKVFLHYIQRWSKDYLRRRLDWMVEDLYGRQDYASNSNPRHLRTALCPCQYIEEHLRNKRQRESLNPCNLSANPCLWCD